MGGTEEKSLKTIDRGVDETDQKPPVVVLSGSVNVLVFLKPFITPVYAFSPRNCD